VFVNPVEIESPYWRFAWIFDDPGECPIDRVAREWLPPATLAKARNMDTLLSYISEHRTTLFEWEAPRLVARQHRRDRRR